MLGQFELFGVTRDRRPRRHTFDKYVTLAVARRTRGVPDDVDDGLVRLPGLQRPAVDSVPATRYSAALATLS